MDWLRLTKSGKDLTGVGGPSEKGKIREISRKELKRHNSPRDAWMAINGMVFNVSAYLDYHPGGRDELMKGAGIDATELFNQVHRWVNYESMLGSCLVGKLVEGDALLESTSKSDLPAPVIPPIVRPTGPVPPTTDYIQTVDKLTINIYTKRKGLSSDQVIVDNCSSSIRIVTYLLDGTGYIVNYQLYSEVKPEVKVRVGASGKVEVMLTKIAPARWLGVGKPLDKHKWFGKVEELALTYRKWRIVEVKEATHDTRYIIAEPPSGCHFSIPPGHHVHMSGDVEGMEVVRSYTPVKPLSAEDEGNYSPQAVHFLIKTYSDGCLTKIVRNFTIGDEVRLSDHTGDFSSSRICDLERVFLLAAGTGATPIVRLLPILPHVPTTLLYFNKTKQDIIWEKELAVFQKENSWLSIVHVLSKEPDYDGAQGRISGPLLNKLLWKGEKMKESGEGGKKEKRLVCICGMTQFSQEANRLFREEFGFQEEEIHLFVG